MCTEKFVNVTVLQQYSIDFFVLPHVLYFKGMQAHGSLTGYNAMLGECILYCLIHLFSATLQCGL